MVEKRMLSKDLDTNIAIIQEIFVDCQDLVCKKFPIGKDLSIQVYALYFDVMVDRDAIENTIIKNFISEGRIIYEGVDAKSDSEKYNYVNSGAIATIDKKEVESIDEIISAVTSGDTAILVEGEAKCIIVATKKFPTRGISEPDNEVVVRGSKDGFTEIYRMNTVLIRRRIRDPRLKLKQFEVGVRSKTTVGIMYMKDLARDSVVSEVEKNIKSFEIDAILDSGMLEQLIEDKGYSPFPQVQATQRPDKTASALLEGRVALIVDNSPFALIVPATLNCFLQASDDYYSRWGIMALTRIIRYIAAVIAVLLPGIYVAVTTFHTAILPTTLALSFATAREGVPFPAALEVLIMEVAFELLREAGIRLPGSIGSTIGIVGGLIVGQAAVTANLVSPIIVIIVALTAICSFAIPNEELTAAIRITKFFILILSAFLGFYGFWLGVIAVLIHLSTLTSYGFPYLMPFIAGSIDNYNDLEDSLFRMPFRKMKKRPIFTKENARVRFRDKKKG
ncbi:MAG: Spore germination protein GerKA [Clostridiales bacterium]|jgi:spore germination protein|nr:Spore germination protein GerKA [Clostridiales bacterium]